MRGIVTPPRPPASRGARGLARRLLAGDVLSEPLLNPAPEPGHPPALEGPPEPSNPAKLAEAHAMARRPDHPLHAALMNPIHPGHRHAVATYEALFRDAYAPAGPAAVPDAAAKPAAEGRKRPLSAPAGGGTGSTLSPANSTGFTGREWPKPNRAQPLVRLAQNEATSADAGDGRSEVEQIIARDAARGAEDQAAARAAMMAAMTNVPPPYRHILPPKTYFVSDETYAAMRNSILELPNLSPQERNIFMRTLTHEGTRYDAHGESLGGIRKTGWPLLQKIVEEMRRIEDRDIPTPDNVKDLSIADIYDAMRAYYLQQLYNLDKKTVYGPRFEKILARHHQEHPLDRIRDPELAFQLFDLEYQHGWDVRNEIWDKAVYRVMARLEREERSLPERLRFLEQTYSISPRQRLEAVEYMQERDGLAREFLGYLREERAKWWIAKGKKDPDGPLQYNGANRARIWGMTQQP